jgi:hypothetical protein
MGMGAWLNLGRKDFLALFFASLIGWLVVRQMPAGDWAVYVYVLISFHLFLGWLVITAEKETGFSLPILSTIFTHLAFVGLVLALGKVGHVLPVWRLVRYAIAAIAVFERGWLFSGASKKGDLLLASIADPAAQPVPPAAQQVYIKPPPAYAPAPATQPSLSTPAQSPKPAAASASDDHSEWLRDRATKDPTQRKLGMSVRDEYEQWMKERATRRTTDTSGKRSPSAG